MDWQDPKNSPHCAQIHINTPNLEYHVDPEFHRFITPSHPHKPYQRRYDQVKSVLHWGQRKLLISEIEFLTIIGRTALINSTIVYAGAAPGTHIHLLSKLFPSVKLILVDPAPFKIRESDSIAILNTFFTDDLATQLSASHKNLYFICDIRTADLSIDTPEESERRIITDMNDQMRWHTLLKSQRSMLKFRLPWDSQTTTYLAGRIYFPVWGNQTTTEARLITDPDPSATATYDHQLYESQMFYFNTITRHSLYSHHITGEGLDHCYDCRAEIHILTNYLTHFAFPTPNILTQVPALSASISRYITKYRTLLDPTPNKKERSARIRKSQHINGVPACRIVAAPIVENG